MACDSPITIKYKEPISDGNGGFIWTFPADCGKCLKCLIKRKAQWSFRMVEEKRMSFSSYFVTLTYDDIHLPWGDGVSTVNKNDHKEFIKKLKYYEQEKLLHVRKYISAEELERKKNNIKEDGKFKYYGVSEYGDLKGRAHWHYILFNVRDIANINTAWTTTLYDSENKPYNGEPKGKVQIDDCNVNTIDYVLKYMVKDHTNQDYSNREKEKSFMSKGLGLGMVNDEFIDYINRVNGNTVVNQRGRELPLPRYYRKKFVKEENKERKNLYINQQIQKTEKKEEKKYGKEYDKKIALSKDRRNHILKSRQKRNHE